MSERHFKYQVAFDAGAGSRGISHHRANPYDPNKQPANHAAREAGWEQTDVELGGEA